MRIFLVCVFAFASLSQAASAATISAVLRGDRAGGSPGEIFGFYNPATGAGTSGGTFGSINPLGGPPDDGQVYTNFITGSREFNIAEPNRVGYIATTVRRQGFKFYSTTQSFFDQNFSAAVVDPMVQQAGYWEFSINGIFDYTINAQAPQITGNVRTYRLEKVGGSILSQDAVGTAQTTRTGQVNSGTYRLYFDHRNFSPNVSGPPGNIIGGTNLDILFTLNSEDPSVVPEPSSLAVFGLLAIAGAVRHRRKSISVS